MSARIHLLALSGLRPGEEPARLERVLARLAGSVPPVVLETASAQGGIALLERMQVAHVVVVLQAEASLRAVPAAIPVAMAGGLCVIASDVGGAEGVIAHGHDGLLVPPGDDEALAAALQRVLGDDEERRRLGEAAARAVRGAA